MFQGYKFHWSISFISDRAAKTKIYWHFCIVESLWKAKTDNSEAVYRKS